MNKSCKALIMGKFISIGAILLLLVTFFNCQNGEESEDPGEPLEITFEVTDPSETGKFDGSIITLVEGGIPPYSFLWSNGDTTKDIEGLSAGIYILTVNDSRVQELKDTVQLIDVVFDIDGNSYGFVRIGDQIFSI